MKGHTTNQEEENDSFHPFDRYGNYIGEMISINDSVPEEKIQLKDIANTIDPNKPTIAIA